MPRYSWRIDRGKRYELGTAVITVGEAGIDRGLEPDGAEYWYPGGGGPAVE